MDDYQGNFLRSLQGGYGFGQQIRQQQEGNKLRQLASLAYGLPQEQRQSHLSELAKLSPEFAQAQQKQWNADDDRDREEIVSMARFIKNAPPEQQAAAYTNTVLPRLRARGMNAPEWSDVSKDTILQTVSALTQWDDDPGDTPSGYREFELLTNAAGYKPGSDEYKNAAGIKLGTNGRASSAGYTSDTIDIGDGKKRASRANPRTGTLEYYDERVGQWLQLGDAGAMGGGPRPGPVPGAGSGFGAGSGDNATQVNIEGIDPAEQQRYANVISTMRAGGFDDAAIADWLEMALQKRAAGQNAGQIPTSNANGPTYVPNPGNPQTFNTGGPRRAPVGVGAGRSKEEEAAAVRDAEIRTDLNYADQRATTEAEAAARKKAAEAEATRVAEARTTYSQVENNASQMLALIDQARSHPGRAVATGLSGTLDPRNRIDGTNARDFRVLMDQMQGKSFLEAFNSLRGGGQITEAEGRKATEAIGRLNTAQSDQAFFAALNELEQVILLGMERAKKATQPRAESGAGWSIVKKGQ